MKKLWSLLLAGILFLTGCANSNGEVESNYASNELLTITGSALSYSVSIESKNELAAANLIKDYFEEIENRDFAIWGPIQIAGEDCYKVGVRGRYTDGETYEIDTLAVNIDNGKQYFLNRETEEFEMLSATPTFACKTSPNGKLRIESMGMNADGYGTSGLYSLEEMRIIDLDTKETLWAMESMLCNEFSWSEDSRYVAVQNSGRQWTQTNVVDTSNYSTILLPGIYDITEECTEVAMPDENAPMQQIEIEQWISPMSIQINFEWVTKDATVMKGTYEYNLETGTLTVQEVEENNYGS